MTRESDWPGHSSLEQDPIKVSLPERRSWRRSLAFHALEVVAIGIISAGAAGGCVEWANSEDGLRSDTSSGDATCVEVIEGAQIYSDTNSEKAFTTEEVKLLCGEIDCNDEEGVCIVDVGEATYLLSPDDADELRRLVEDGRIFIPEDGINFNPDITAEYSGEHSRPEVN